MKRLYRLTPHARLTHNPLFALEARRVRWGGSSAGRCWSTAVAGLRIICCALLIVWLVISLRDLRQYNFGDFPSSC